jgi:hypothetical protein
MVAYRMSSHVSLQRARSSVRFVADLATIYAIVRLTVVQAVVLGHF